MEMYGLDVAEFLHRHPLADGGSSVKSLAKVPGLAFLAQLLLQLARRKVDAYGDGVVITMCESLRDGLSQLRYSHHQFGLIIDASEVVRDEERLVVLKQSRVRLEENHRTLRFI